MQKKLRNELLYSRSKVHETNYIDSTRISQKVLGNDSYCIEIPGLFLTIDLSNGFRSNITE